MPRIYFIFAFAIVAFAVAAAVGADRFGASSRRFGSPKLVGAEPVAAIEVPRAQEALSLWKSRYHGRIALFFDEEWPRFDATSYYNPSLYRNYPFRVFNLADQGERDHLSDVNFLYFAALRGTVRDIRAVLSSRGMADVAARAASAHNAQLAGAKIFSTHHGLPRTFTTLAVLEQPGEPVLMFVSPRFFRAYEPTDLYRRLADLGIVTDSLVICREIGNSSVSETEREKLAEFVRLLGEHR